MALACRRLLLRTHQHLAPVLVPAISGPFPAFSQQQQRFIAMSAPSRQQQIDEAVDQLKEKNPFYERYAAKLAALKEKQPDEFLEKVSRVVQPPKVVEKPVEKPRDYAELLHPKESLKTAAKSPAEIPHKQLSDLMRLELLQDKSAAELQLIWLEYHKQKEVLNATIPVEQYDLQLARGKQHPMFIVPLPRSEGFEFFLFQFAANTVHFTPLLCYQVHKENAPECLNIVYYTEMRDKGVVLMRGEYDKNVINAQEAQCLANQLQLYYAQHSATKLALLEQFTRRPAEFEHQAVIKELENLSIV